MTATIERPQVSNAEHTAHVDGEERPQVNERKSPLLLKLLKKNTAKVASLQPVQDENICDLANIAAAANEQDLNQHERKRRNTFFDAAAAEARTQSRTYLKASDNVRTAQVLITEISLQPEDFNAEEKGDMMKAHVKFMNAGRDRAAKELLKNELARIWRRAAERITDEEIESSTEETSPVENTEPENAD